MVYFPLRVLYLHCKHKKQVDALSRSVKRQRQRAVGSTVVDLLNVAFYSISISIKFQKILKICVKQQVQQCYADLTPAKWKTARKRTQITMMWSPRQWLSIPCRNPQITWNYNVTQILIYPLRIGSVAAVTRTDCNMFCIIQQVSPGEQTRSLKCV